jgi:phosphatidylserine/phosphatidylglycerophosphate/cardiolipin synthase-like enzyme
MNFRNLWLVSAALLAATCCACDAAGPRTLPPVEVYFSPQGGATDAVVREIDHARQTILVQAYSFTSRAIAKALVRARQRGAAVQVILDPSNLSERFSLAGFLARGGIPVLIDAAHEIAHNKIMILDGAVVITGSFNFTHQAEVANAENLLILRDHQIAARYADNWHEHERHSAAYSAR